jgi:flagellar assembly protein FliH
MVFAPDGAILRDGKGFRSQFTAEEIEAARAVAFEEGRHVEVARAEKDTAQAAERLAADAAHLVSQLEAECASLRAEACALAIAVARQIAGAALDAFGEERIERIVQESMDMLRHGPRLTIRVPTNSYNSLRPRLESAAQQSAYPGALVMREDSALPAGDVTIEWAEGLIAYDREALIARIEDIMARTLEAPRDQPETHS